MRVPRLISGVRVIGRRLGLRAPLGTSTWRRYWWSEVLIPPQSICAWRWGDAASVCLPEPEPRAMRLCLGHGADVNWADKRYYDAVLYDACKKRPRRRGAAVAGQRRGGRSGDGEGTRWTPLFIACQNGHVDAARLLLDKGAEVDRAEKDGGTPLFIACEKGHVDAARLLLDKGAEVDRADKDGLDAAVHRLPERPRRRGAAAAGQRRGGRPGGGGRARRRCSSPARRATSTRRGCCWTKARRSTGRMEDGRTPLYIACQNGHVDAARLLLDKGAEVDRANKHGRRRCSSPARTATSTRRGCCWRKARRSTGRRRTVRRRCSSPAERPRRRGAAVAGQRRGGRSGDGEGRRDAAVHRLPEGPRRRGAAVAGQRRGGRSGDEGGARRRCSSPAEKGHVDAARLLLDNGAEVDQAEEDGCDAAVHRLLRTATSTRRGCCWRKARRSIGRTTADAAVRRLPRATSTRRGCCWTKARRSTGRRRTVRRRCSSPARMGHVDAARLF